MRSDVRRIVSWNINSIRARVEQVIEWARRADADVLLLQETKCGDADFPFDAFDAAGYEVAHHGVNHWNGVAIASRIGIADVTRGFHGPQAEPFDEPRLIAADCGGIRCWSVYVPNGRELWDPHYAFKLVWLERLRHELLDAQATDGPASSRRTTAYGSIWRCVPSRLPPRSVESGSTARRGGQAAPRTTRHSSSTSSRRTPEG